MNIPDLDIILDYIKENGYINSRTKDRRINFDNVIKFLSDNNEKYLIIHESDSSFPTSYVHFIYKGMKLTWESVYGQGSFDSISLNHEKFGLIYYDFDTENKSDGMNVVFNILDNVVECCDIDENFVPKTVIKINREMVTDLSNLMGRNFCQNYINGRIKRLLRM